MPAYAPNPEDFNPFERISWRYAIYTLPQPDWLKNAARPFWEHRSGRTRKIPWGLTIGINSGPVPAPAPGPQSFTERFPCFSFSDESPPCRDGKGFITIIGGSHVDPRHDGEMKAEWEGEGSIKISISLNQRRLAANSMGLLKNPEALALDVVGSRRWTHQESWKGS